VLPFTHRGLCRFRAPERVRPESVQEEIPFGKNDALRRQRPTTNTVIERKGRQPMLSRNYAGDETLNPDVSEVKGGG